ncbi:unnamed protein product [Malus baccata var. baccata]
MWGFLMSAFIVKRDYGIALHHLQMSEFGSPSDGGSPNSNSRFELAMLESSGPLLESCTKNSRLGNLRNCQALANIGSSSFMSVVEKVGKKWEINTKKGKTPMLVPVDDILFHKGAREERRLLPPLPTINPIFPPTMEFTDQKGGPSRSRKRKYKEEVGSIHQKDLKVAIQPSSFRYVNNCLAGRQSTVDELGEPLDENESDRDRMMMLSSYVMTEYDDRLRELEWYKVKFKENKQFVNDARKTSKALADAICLKDENFESLKRRNEELDSALAEVSGLKMSIPTERDAAVQEFLGSQAFHDAFKPHCIQAANFKKRKWMAVPERYDNGSIIRNKQSHESEDGPGDAEEAGNGNRVETQSDIVRGLASNKDDS